MSPPKSPSPKPLSGSLLMAFREVEATVQLSQAVGSSQLTFAAQIANRGNWVEPSATVRLQCWIPGIQCFWMDRVQREEEETRGMFILTGAPLRDVAQCQVVGEFTQGEYETGFYRLAGIRQILAVWSYLQTRFA